MAMPRDTLAAHSTLSGGRHACSVLDRLGEVFPAAFMRMTCAREVSLTGIAARIGPDKFGRGRQRRDDGAEWTRQKPTARMDRWDFFNRAKHKSAIAESVSVG